VVFDRARAVLTRYSVAGSELLKQGPVFSVARATIDNDRTHLEAVRMLTTLTDTVRRFVVSQTEDAAVVTVHRTLDGLYRPEQVPQWKKDRGKPEKSGPGGFHVSEVYRVLGDGCIEVVCAVEPFGLLPDLQRIGYEWTTPAGFDRFDWYGRGPHESYGDRRASAYLGAYHGTVDEQFVNYPVPQENGNKTDVRWAMLRNDSGARIKIYGQQPLSVSVRHYSTENLEAAKHPYDLKKIDETVMNIDYQHGPLGNASCGAGPLDKYKIKIAPARFNFYIEGFGAGSE